MAYLCHPTGAIMNFPSEEKKQEFLQLMRDQNYPLYNWFMSFQEKAQKSNTATRWLFPESIPPQVQECGIVRYRKSKIEIVDLPQ